MDGGLKGRRLVSQKRIERVRDASAGEIAVIIYRLQYTEKRGGGTQLYYTEKVSLLIL